MTPTFLSSFEKLYRYIKVKYRVILQGKTDAPNIEFGKMPASE